MKKFFISGLLIVIIPLLGIPLVWKTAFLISIGLFIVVKSFTYSKENNQDSRKKDDEGLDRDRVFIENEEKFEKD